MFLPSEVAACSSALVSRGATFDSEGRKKKDTQAASADNTGRRDDAGARFAFVCTRGKERLPNPGYGIEASLPAPVAALYCDFYISSRRGPARSKALCSMHTGNTARLSRTWPRAHARSPVRCKGEKKGSAYDGL